MPKNILVTGLDEMVREFSDLAAGAKSEARARFTAAANKAYAATQAAVPVGEGDPRRPAGALKASGRLEINTDGDVWEAKISYGTESDFLPYAHWALDKGESEYISAADVAIPEMQQTMNDYFKAVFDKDAPI